MQEIEFLYEIDHEKRVFRARTFDSGVVLEAPSPDGLRIRVRDAVVGGMMGSVQRPVRILLKYNTGVTAETIVLT